MFLSQFFPSAPYTCVQAGLFFLLKPSLDIPIAYKSECANFSTSHFRHT